MVSRAAPVGLLKASLVAAAIALSGCQSGTSPVTTPPPPPPSPPATGSLAITFAGLPAAAAGSAIVSGPGSYTHSLSTSQTISDLAPGNYTVSASDVVVDTVTYLAPVGSQAATVTANNTASVTLTYTPRPPATGALTVSRLADFPSGASASVTVTGPAGFSQIVTGTQAFTIVTPGVYTVTAAAVSAGGFSYAPATTTQTATVIANGATTASVVYGATDGHLAVATNGLPAGAAASVTVTGPGGYAQAVSTAAQTLTGLGPGSYTITAANVTTSGVTYVPSPATQSITVSVGSTSPATVGYAVSALPPPPTTGSATITVGGLPSGVAAKISVTGPGGPAFAVTSTQTLSNLALGTYTVTAASVNPAGIQYMPTVTTQTVVVGGGVVAGALVTYVAGPTPQYLPITPGFLYAQ